MICRVVLGSKAKWALLKVPPHVVTKFQDWVEDVEERGLEAVRKIPGYHDEPCLGKLRGMRSVRLSRAYRMYYSIQKDRAEFVFVERIDKHEY